MQTNSRSAQAGDAPQVLGHLRVVDFSDTLGGQYCARLFADFGAEVVLVEGSDGSSVRQLAPRSIQGDSLQFFHLNTGKRSVTADLESADGRSRFEALVRGADVVVMPPGFDAATLGALNSAAILVVVSNFGDDGPLADWQGPEIVLQALSGMMFSNGGGKGEPLYGMANRASMAAGIAAYIGATTALFARQHLGRGQIVRVDSAETAAAMCFPYVMQHIYNGHQRARTDQAVSSGQVLCRDGWVCIWIYDFRWNAVLTALGLTEIEHDPRFAKPADRRKNWDELFAIIQAKIADQAAEDVVEALQQAQVIAAKAYRPSELRESAHLKARDYWEEVDGHTILGPAFRLYQTPRRISRGAPALGEANGQISWPAKTAAMANGGEVQAPLSGIRVVELTTAWAGPMSGRVLAFMGAESIHVESPNRVNSWRLNHESPNPNNFPGREPGGRPFDRSFLFNSQNVNKLSCILNLKTEEGRATLRRLVAKTDVLICNFRPGTLKKLGLDYESLTSIKPDIIVAELPAFGVTGPMSGYAALGPTMEMAAGMSAMIAYPNGQPEVTGPSYLDPIGGFNAAAAILTALLHRQRTGQGQYVEVPQVESAMQLIGAEILSATEAGTDAEPDGNHSPLAVPHDAFPARGDDEWMVIAALDETQWNSLCSVMDRAELAADPRFATLENRKRNEGELTGIISVWSQQFDKQELAARLQAAGVAAAPVNAPRDLLTSAYLASRNFFTELEHPDAGRHPHPGLPIHLSATPGAQRKSAPPFGAHNRQVLESILALPPEDIASIEATAMGDRPW